MEQNINICIRIILHINNCRVRFDVYLFVIFSLKN
jgi:hypothetical protein